MRVANELRAVDQLTRRRQSGEAGAVGPRCIKMSATAFKASEYGWSGSRATSEPSTNPSRTPESAVSGTTGSGAGGIAERGAGVAGGGGDGDGACIVGAAATATGVAIVVTLPVGGSWTTGGGRNGAAGWLQEPGTYGGWSGATVA